MNAFQASLYELERTQQNVKKQYVFFCYFIFCRSRLSLPPYKNYFKGLLVNQHVRDSPQHRYEEEISRLRQQLEQARAGHPPLPSGSVPPTQQSHPSQQHSQPAPPNIGPASNLFGGMCFENCVNGNFFLR